MPRRLKGPDGIVRTFHDVMYVLRDDRTGLYWNHRTVGGPGEWLTTTAWAPTFTDEHEAWLAAFFAGLDLARTTPVPLLDGVGGYHQEVS